MEKPFKYMRICPICGNTYETNDNELITYNACKACRVTPKKKNSSLIIKNQTNYD